MINTVDLKRKIIYFFFKVSLFFFLGFCFFCNFLYCYAADAIQYVNILETPDSVWFAAEGVMFGKDGKGVAESKYLIDFRKFAYDATLDLVSSSTENGNGVLISGELLNFPELYEGTKDSGTRVALNSTLSSDKRYTFYFKDYQGRDRVVELWRYTHSYDISPGVPGVCNILSDDSTERCGNDSGVEKNQAAMSRSSRYQISKIYKALQEGVGAASIDCSFNILTCYSNTQIPLSSVMLEVPNDSGNNSNTEDKESTSETDKKEEIKYSSNGYHYEFKNSSQLVLGIDYNINPLFGELKIGSNLFETVDFSSTDLKSEKNKWWKNKFHTINIAMGDIEVIDEYGSFFAQDLGSQGIYKVTNELNMYDKKMVEAYSDGIVSKAPGQFMGYNMRVVVPSTFQKNVSKYALPRTNSSSYKLIESINLCVLNDIFYASTENKKLTTCSDLSLQRDYLYLYKYTEGTGKNAVTVGAVIVCKFNEGVVDTDEENPFLYYTGRKLIFDNAYSNNMMLEAENANLFGISTAQQQLQGSPIKNYAFNTVNSKEENLVIPSNFTDFLGVLTKKENHFAVDTRNKPQSIQIAIVFNPTSKKLTDTGWVENNDDTDVSVGTVDEESNVKKLQNKVLPVGFYMLWNNSLVEDGNLISWLDTKEAQSTTYVYASELKKIIRGEFDVEQLTFEEWMKIKDIKSQLDYNKNNIVYRVVNIVGIISGAAMIIFMLLLLMAYWIDIFNTFTNKSILHTISLGHLYPIVEDSMSDYLKGVYGSEVHYVTFKNMLKIAIFGILIGYLLLNISFIVTAFIKIYFVVMNLLGGI